MSRKLIRIHGSGGGKGGSGNTYEADDNLFSRQSAAFIDALAEGPIKGLVYGDASILIDEVRLRNINLQTGVVDAKTNFNNFVMTTSHGTANPGVDPEFFSDYPTAATTQEVGSAELLYSEPQFFTLSSGTFEKTNADYLKITISTSGMSKITKTGKKKGDINTTFNNFNIDFVYTDEDGVIHTVNKFRTGFNGKVKSKYAHTFGFNIENHKPFVDWAIKVTRTDQNNSSPDFEISNAIFVDSIEVAIADKLEYPYTAYIAGVLDAEQFGSIPARGYEIDGKLIQIPSNHFPCDYNGRKVVLDNVTGLTVGDSVKQQLNITSIAASGTNEEGYIGTATVSPAHGMAVGKTFTVTISGATEDADFYNGTFVAEATTTTKFKYNLNRPESNGTFTSLSDTNPAGIIKGQLFTGGLIDKIVGTTVYLRDVDASNSVLKGDITFIGVSDSTARTKEVESFSKVFIPANYRRNSSGKLTTSDQDWDGSFYQSWCNNPAWVFNDLVTNKIYGLGNYLNQNQINKWELYQIGRYCDELVPAGIPASDFATLFTTNDTNYTPGASSLEHEPRFSANLVINGKEEAYKVLNDVVSIFRGMIYWLNGEALVVQDSEKDPVYQFTNGNVIDGEFTYEGTANKTRTNSVTVTFNNPQDYYRKRVEHVELEETLQKEDEFIKPQAITAFGCTSRGQARRLGKWTLLTNNLHTNTVTFNTSLNAAFLRPGDIIQVIDQLKSGKSWGGRVSTSSTTTAINIDRKPTGFGDTSVETGYVVGDYRLSATFVKYAALLAQDTATINISGTNTNFVRGQEIPNITSEEAAVNIQDTSGDLVFTQWTPYTVVETQTLSNVSNSGKTLTVASAFSSAPSQDTIWTLSRAALQTGKTKEESKLYRIMSIAETEMNNFEITGLEYNASKFDAVDKNEELTEYRTINLPDSFEEVPQVDADSIEIFPSVEPIAGEGNFQNVLNITWDPVLKADGTPYAFLRGFNVEYSRDGTKWIGAGTTNSTSIEIDGAVSDNYYARVYTVSLQGKKSPPASSGQKEVNFNNVLFVEGTVGNGDYVIPMTGIINSEFNINSTSGSVTFTPDSFSYNNSPEGANISVSSQASLDFSSLSNGDEAYVYFDYSAAAFKAIRFDATGDQFYEVGSNVYEDATGTISCAGNTKAFTGSGTDFDPELGLNNTFKVTHNSTNFYPRVAEITNDTNLKVRRNFNRVLSGVSFQKPTFFAEYNGTGDNAGEFRDTIMGKVTKAGDVYTLITFGVSRGEQGFSVFGTNESHVFAAGSTGEIAQSDYQAYTNDYTVSRGTTEYTFADSGSVSNTFGITINSVTGFASTDKVNVNSTNGQITIDDNSMDTITSASVNLTITDLGTGEDIATRIISFAKASDGTDGVDGVAASAGEDAKTVNLTASSFSIAYDENGANPSPSTSTDITLTATPINFTAPRYKFTGEGIDPDDTSYGTSATKTFEVPSTYPTTLADRVQTVKVSVSEAADINTEVAFDEITINMVSDSADGADAYTPIVTTQAHTFPASDAGVVSDYANSGTDIRVFKGATRLTPTTGTPSTGQFKVTASATNITVDANPSFEDIDSDSTDDTVRFGNASSFGDSDNTAEIEYSINCEGSITLTVSQTFTKSKEGEDGTDGATVNFAFVRVPESTSASSVVATTDGTENTPADFTISSTTYSWSDDVPSGTGLLYAVRGTKAGDATGFTWGTPYRLEGTLAKELIIYSNVTTGDAPSDPTATYNFTTGVLSLTSNANLWNLEPPSFGNTPADGAKIHAVTCVVTGTINATAVAVAAADWSSAFVYAIHEKGDQGDPGTEAVTVILTNESTSATSFSLFGGTETINYAGTGGEMKLYEGTTEKTSGVVYGGSGFTDNGSTRSKTQNNLTCTINESTGVYSFSGASWSSTSETFTLQATYDGETYSKIVSINKISGLQRVEISASESVFKFATDDASAATPTSITLTANAFSVFPGSLQYKWYKDGTAISSVNSGGFGSTSSITVADGSFSDGNEVYKVEARNTTSGGNSPFDEDTFTISRIADGSDGTDGDNIKFVKLYTSKSTTPTKPSNAQGFNTSTGAAVAGTYQSSVWTLTPGTPTTTNKIWIATATLIQTNGTGDYAVDGSWDVGVHSSSEIKVVVAYYNKTSSPNTAPSAPSGEVTSTATTANQWSLTKMSASGGSVVWQVIGSNATGSFVYGPVFRAFDLEGLDALTGLDFSSGTGLGILNLTTNDYLNSQVDQTFIADAISDASGFRTSIGAGTSNFDGSAANLTGNIDPARFSSSDFPMLSTVTAANAAAARTAIGAGTSNFSGSAADLSGNIDPARFSTSDFPMLSAVTAANAAAARTAIGASDFSGSAADLTGNIDPDRFSSSDFPMLSAVTAANAAAARTAIGAGTSNFNGSAANLTGNIDPARFSSSDFPMLSTITAANASAARTAIGAGTSNFSGSAADLSGNIAPARFSSSDFPMLSTVTAANAAAARTAIGAGTSNFSGNASDLSGNINLTNQVTGTLPAAQGGTGITNFSNSTHLNANITQSQIDNAITDGANFATQTIGLGAMAFKGSVTDNDLAGSATITKEADFGFSGIAITSGSQSSNFVSYNGGTSYNSQGTTGTITVTPTLSSGTSQSCTFTWSRTGGNVSGFSLTNTGTGNDAWTSSTFGSAAAGKQITVTHTASGLQMALNCTVTTTTSSSPGGGGGGGGGCFLPGTLVDLQDGTQQAIETLEIGQKVRGGTVLAKDSYEVDYWYKLNNLELTAGHPVWIEGKGWSCIDPVDYYKEAEEFGHAIQVEPVRLNIGDKTTNGKIERIERINEKATVWNITVDNKHTYYVNGILVHNAKF